MRAVAAAGDRAFRQRFVGRTMAVLWETSRPGEDGPVWSGLTDNYLRVQAAGPADLANTITHARLVALAGGALQGVVEKSKAGDGQAHPPLLGCAPVASDHG
jgi:tRNA A37 methylthiotransferase MiaB